jgi:PAS domain S-box-containing protein
LAQEGIWVIDANSKTTMVNASMARLLGYEADEMIGKYISSFLDEKARRIANINLERLKKGISEQYDFEFIRKNGKRIFTTIATTPIINEKGKYTGAMAGVIDITERKHNQQIIYNAVIHAEEEERGRVAKDLHDGVLPVLSTLKLYLQSLYDSKEKNLRAMLMDKVNDTINDAFSSIKEISNNLSPHILHNFGLISALQTFIDRITEIKKIKIELDHNFKKRFNENTETTLYRVVIELINNTIKHAMASSISITLNKEKNIHLHYEDDGKGFDYMQVIKSKKGMGLFNMRNRIESINGEVYITSSPGKGMKVNILIPLNGELEK